MKIAFFGSSILSAYWNGAATYYRGLIRSLHARGHRVTFYEPDAFERQKHRDLEDPSWVTAIVYPDSSEAALRQVELASDSDLVIKTSGVGVFDELLEQAVLDFRRGSQIVAFWDVDAPATLERVLNRPSDPFRKLIPQYDAIFTQILSQPSSQEVTPYFDYFVLEAMAITGHRSEALDLIREVWGGMLNAGATAFWEIDPPGCANATDVGRCLIEDFDKFSSQGTRYVMSMAHGWSSGPGVFLMESGL